MERKPPEKDRTKLKIAALAVLAGSSVAVLFYRFGPHEEPPMPKQCPERQCAPEPRRDDLICMVAHGEADPLSQNFDPESCGYCGDGIRQIRINGVHGSTVRIDEFGIKTQDVTERPTEIPSNDPRALEEGAAQRYVICDVDFHCGNGRVDRNQQYAAWIPGNPVGVPYRLGTKTIDETPDSCSLDHPEERHTRRRPVLPQEDTPAPIAPRSGFHCPSHVASTDSTEIVSSQSASTRGVLRRINDAIIGRAENLRSALRVGNTAPLDVVISMLVDPTGRISLQSVSARSGGASIGDQTAIINATGLSLGGLSLIAPGAECNWTITIRVPTITPPQK